MSTSMEKYRRALIRWYYKKTGEWLDLDNPKTWNEKMQWLKLYDNTPIKTQLADKLLVRDWIKEQIGEKYLVPLLGVYDKFDDIDFSKLPDCFIIKCNHGSGWNIIVKDKNKMDIADTKKRINQWMSQTYGKDKFEFQYWEELLQRIVLTVLYCHSEKNHVCHFSRLLLVLLHKENIYFRNYFG